MLDRLNEIYRKIIKEDYTERNFTAELEEVLKKHNFVVDEENKCTGCTVYKRDLYEDDNGKVWVEIALDYSSKLEENTQQDMIGLVYWDKKNDSEMWSSSGDDVLAFATPFDRFAGAIAERVDELLDMMQEKGIEIPEELEDALYGLEDEFSAVAFDKE